MPKSLPARSRFTAGPSRGEVRRELLLQTLEELLVAHEFATIEIADITRVAGVSRSTFYFYFPSKAAAVGAMLGNVFSQVSSVTETWTELGDTLAERRNQVFDGFEQVVAIWREHAHLMAAMFDAVTTDDEVRGMFDDHIERFVVDSATRIRREREAGHALPGPAPETLARVLVGMNVKALERDMRQITGGSEPDPDLANVLATVWDRMLYAS
ncbi:TetR/AcrR family transcriptional regulator [[Mycobacterium] burgundiense]|uniref:TetR/AcrR family transcriptional regulator n=1 Tax=[Mycobacterium] burgundiense TaxID=3064286 RepID=A0ABN9NF52_9MYCO|nr:TetR/AcrR family transcriptional regulator [Mycolicibacterium sp. MU0053]CAJ1503533.1 TetR/AcrR family transcriptional regulator [Mycolicibacterium sp. MU0053]